MLWKRKTPKSKHVLQRARTKHQSTQTKQLLIGGTTWIAGREAGYLITLHVSMVTQGRMERVTPTGWDGNERKQRRGRSRLFLPAELMFALRCTIMFHTRSHTLRQTQVIRWDQIENRIMFFRLWQWLASDTYGLPLPFLTYAGRNNCGPAGLFLCWESVGKISSMLIDYLITENNFCSDALWSNLKHDCLVLFFLCMCLCVSACVLFHHLQIRQQEH